MAIGVDEITEAASALRRAQAQILARMPQSAIVATLAALARRWRDPQYALRREAERLTEPFPFAMVRVSLDALLASMTDSALWKLIDSEEARDCFGDPLIGHVIAGNTPLLAWTSMIRALLVRSASLVKLPSNAASCWGRLFVDSLLDTAPELAGTIRLLEWPGGTASLDSALCCNVDRILAYGSDKSLNDLRRLCADESKLVGYGHRASFGIVLSGAAIREAAAGFALDTLLYDQGGCLSPQTVFVEGSLQEAALFAQALADALAKLSSYLPPAPRPAAAAAGIRESRLLAQMEAGTHLWEDTGLRWTVILRPQTIFTASPTYGVLSVQPLEKFEEIDRVLLPLAGRLQGCAIAAPADSETLQTMAAALKALGVSYRCAPGEMQSPPLSWRQDGRPLLKGLLR